MTSRQTCPSGTWYHPLLFLSLWLAGCAALPFPSSKGESFIWHGTYAEVWDSVLEVLKKEEIPVMVEDQTRGHIQTKTFPLYENEYAKWARKPLLAPSGYCALEIGVFRQSETMTSVRIQAYFKRKNSVYLFGVGRKDRSRGLFEKLLAGRINNVLVKKKMPKLNHVVVGCTFRLMEESLLYMIADAGPQTMAYEQGLRNGDIILKIDGKDVSSENLFGFFLGVQGEEVKTFTVRRRKETIEVPVSIFYLAPDSPKIGVSVERDDKMGHFIIKEVRSNSPAEKADLQVGDILLEEGELMLINWRNYYRAILQEKKGKKQFFIIERDGKLMERMVTPR